MPALPVPDDQAVRVRQARGAQRAVLDRPAQGQLRDRVRQVRRRSLLSSLTLPSLPLLPLPCRTPSTFLVGVQQLTLALVQAPPLRLAPLPQDVPLGRRVRDRRRPDVPQAAQALRPSVSSSCVPFSSLIAVVEPLERALTPASSLSIAACHFPSACPADAPCPKLIKVHCECGNLSQNARCGACDDKPEGNAGRLVKCTDACATAKRNAQLADALGVEQREVKTREVEYQPELVSFYAANSAWSSGIEAQLVEFVKGDKPSLHFPVMKRPQRQFVRPSSLSLVANLGRPSVRADSALLALLLPRRADPRAHRPLPAALRVARRGASPLGRVPPHAHDGHPDADARRGARGFEEVGLDDAQPRQPASGASRQEPQQRAVPRGRSWLRRGDAHRDPRPAHARAQVHPDLGRASSFLSHFFLPRALLRSY